MLKKNYFFFFSIDDFNQVSLNEFKGEKEEFCRCLLKIKRKPIKTNDLITNNCQFGVTESSSVGKCLNFIRLLSTDDWFIIFIFYFLGGLSWNFRSWIRRIKCQIKYNFLHEYSNDSNSEGSHIISIKWILRWYKNHPSEYLSPFSYFIFWSLRSFGSLAAFSSCATQPTSNI